VAAKKSRVGHPASWPISVLLEECEIRRQRRSGPGGQHRNKVETGIVITHRPSGCRAEATERRSQQQNQRNAVHRLRVELAVGIRCPVETGSPPSELWRSRCHGGRISVSEKHDDFPALLAEALDRFAHFDWEVRNAAQSLSCNASQLTKLVQLHPRAFLRVNNARAAAGLHPLK
jgi:hypothetical protein